MLGFQCASCSFGLSRWSLAQGRSSVTSRAFSCGLGSLLLFSAIPARAVILWSDLGPIRVHETGPGADLLGGAVKRDEASNDTLYFKVHVDPLSDQTTEEYFAAFELYEGDEQRL